MTGLVPSFKMTELFIGSSVLVVAKESGGTANVHHNLFGYCHLFVFVARSFISWLIRIDIVPVVLIAGMEYAVLFLACDDQITRDNQRGNGSVGLILASSRDNPFRHAYHRVLQNHRMDTVSNINMRE